MTTPEGPKKHITKNPKPCRKSAVFKPFCSPLLQPQHIQPQKDTTTPNTATKVPERNKENVEDELNGTPEEPGASQVENKSKYQTPCRRLGLSRPKKKTQKPFCSPLVNRFCSPILEDGKNNEKSEEAPQEVVKKRKLCGNLELTVNREKVNESLCTKDSYKSELTSSELSPLPIEESICSPVSEGTKNTGCGSEKGSQEDSVSENEAENFNKTNEVIISESPISSVGIKHPLKVDQIAPKKPKLQPDTAISSSKSVQLGRFTTEEYLAEYERDPESFAKSLDENNDSEDDFVPLKDIKNKSRKKKAYTAIYYPISKSKVSKNLTVVLQRETLTTESYPSVPSDEEMFTCSPEDEKKQRQNLLNLINTLKEENTEKEKLLDRLQYCEIYKKKHDREKLEACTEKWLKGCKRGLKELLPKMQELGPIDMGLLVKKLCIPEYIINKLSVA